MSDLDVSQSMKSEATMDSLRSALAALKAQQKSLDPKSVVFEYSPYVEVGTGYVIDRKTFEDGRYRVVLNPEYESLIDMWLLLHEVWPS